MPDEVRRVPQQERARRSLDAILDATAELLAEDDGSTVTMSAIGQRAGISKAAIYRYYPDRSAVMRALATRYLDQLDVYLDRQLANITTVPIAIERCASIIDRVYELMLTEPALRSIWITNFNSSDLGKLTLETAERLGERFGDALQPVLEGQPEIDRLRLAMAIHMCRAAIEMALHRGLEGAIVVEEFKRVIFLAANLSEEDRAAVDSLGQAGSPPTGEDNSQTSA